MRGEKQKRKTQDPWKLTALLLGILIVVLAAGMLLLFLLGGSKGQSASQEAAARTELSVMNPSGEDAKETSETLVVKNTAVKEKEEETPDSSTESHRYEVVPARMTWTAAGDACKSSGGYLATVTSAEEYSKILEAADASGRKVLWLGAKRSTGSNFAWITGESFSYSSWLEGEPNNEGGNEDYLVMFSVNGQWVWADVPEDLSPYYDENQVGYICEYEE